MAFTPIPDALASAASYQSRDMWTPSGNYNYSGSPGVAAANTMKGAAPKSGVSGGIMGGLGDNSLLPARVMQDVQAQWKPGGAYPMGISTNVGPPGDRTAYARGTIPLGTGLGPPGDRSVYTPTPAAEAYAQRQVAKAGVTLPAVKPAAPVPTASAYAQKAAQKMGINLGAPARATPYTARSPLWNK
jgi:hypothetical protein